MQSYTRLKKLPTEAAPPHHVVREVTQLGTLDADARAIASKALFSTDELKAKAEAATKRRVWRPALPTSSRTCSPSSRRPLTRR